jgi:hypothetical protein
MDVLGVRLSFVQFAVRLLVKASTGERNDPSLFAGFNLGLVVLLRRFLLFWKRDLHNHIAGFLYPHRNGLVRCQEIAADLGPGRLASRSVCGICPRRRGAGKTLDPAAEVFEVLDACADPTNLALNNTLSSSGLEPPPFLSDQLSRLPKSIGWIHTLGETLSGVVCFGLQLSLSLRMGWDELDGVFIDSGIVFARTLCDFLIVCELRLHHQSEPAPLAQLIRRLLLSIVSAVLDVLLEFRVDRPCSQWLLILLQVSIALHCHPRRCST